MDITCLKAGESARIVSVEAKGELKERLRALSVHAGVTIRVLKVSFFKKTYLIESGSVVALRREVASCVKVVKI